MTTQDAYGPSMTPPIPPTEPFGYVPIASRPSWPKVIGIISIVLGSLGTLQGCSTALSPFFLPFAADFMRAMPPQAQNPGVDSLTVAQKWLPWTVTQGLLSLAVAILLLVSGIGLLQRRPWGVSASRVWAVIKILLAAFVGVLTYYIVGDQVEAMRNAPNMPPMPQGFFAFIGIWSTVLGLLLGWAYPVFMLIWLGRRTVCEECRLWNQAS